MSASASRGRVLARQVRALPDEDFAEFLDELVATEDELDPELRRELERRIRSIEDGTAVLLDGDEVMARLREKFPAAFTEDPDLLREVDRRLERYDRGEAVLHTPAEVEQYIRAKYQRS